ncbi:uncharacterized protein LOC112600215 [Melanaphis sacchari]|uniref:uncharacterized protein LOC112600215 n=1 Tax=Melanaphis sacchari TaxID=742174 RepID=UPI000DC13229|nr:uncharacterized protein LOC112600215 [Melanaphis sacchari]
MQIFQLNTVTYGIVSASFLATACLYKLAEDEHSNFPKACNTIKNDFYMDDYLGGANTKEMAIQLRNDLRTVLQSGGFNLRKWSANDPELLKNLNTENSDSMLVLELENEMAKVLGVLWHPRKDIFQYKVQDTSSEIQSTTKRSILAQIASLFDPLGLVGPIIIKAKILTQAMLANSRLKYWIIGGRNIARHIFHQCVKCFRLRPTVVEPIMADLPSERLVPNRPFKKCGVDYAGPITIKTSLRRNATTIKGYICVFVCFSTRAVHIELVADLTAEAFLNALKRFIGRRGVCSDIFSDNATNFVGANNKLLELKKIFHTEEHLTKIYDALSSEGIRWHFIPPRSPHFGGLWEASIKSIKNHLYRVLGTANLTYDELNTILIKIEAVLNSRPLTPCSSDPTDTTPLTPAHFLIGEPTCSLPEPDLTGIPENRLKRWQWVTQLTQILWKRWSKEYLSQLQTRQKWLANRGPKLKIGTIVLVKEDDVPPMSWSMGRVVRVQAGDDGVIRVATILSKGKEISRAVRKLCPLPFEDNSS